MNTRSPTLPIITVNRTFMEALIAAPAPYCALGLVEVEDRQCGFLALRSAATIPPEVSASGFHFGHSLYGNENFEVIHFAFEFYGFETYNVLINPNNAIVQSVLQAMIQGGDYFFFSLDAQRGSATMFRADLGESSLANLTREWERIQGSTTTEAQYCQAIAHFGKKAHPPGILSAWVCGDDINYLDLTRTRFDLNPA